MGEKLFAQVEAFYKSAAALTEFNTGLLRESGSVLGCRLDPFHLEVPVTGDCKRLTKMLILIGFNGHCSLRVSIQPIQ